jgi:hypothetical protein
MVRRFLADGLLVILTLSFSLASHGGDKAAPKLPTPPTNTAFEKLKKLAGTWLLADKDGKPTDQVASIIKVTAGGSAIHETLFPGQPHEMISVYTGDRRNLTLERFFVDGSDLKRGAIMKTRMLGKQLDSVSHVTCLQDPQAAKLLFRFDERTIGNVHCAIPPA